MTVMRISYDSKVRTDLAGHSEQGPRNYNEDRHLVIQLDLAGARHSLLAVADGLGVKVVVIWPPRSAQMSWHGPM